MQGKIFSFFVLIEAGLGEIAIVAVCLSVIFFHKNRKRHNSGERNTVVMKSVPIICLGTALFCFLSMLLVYKGVKPEIFPELFPYWSEYAKRYTGYDAVVDYQGEEYVCLDMEIDMSRLKTSECKGSLKNMGNSRPSADTKGKRMRASVYEIENETGFPLLYVKRFVREDETEGEIYCDDLYCKRKDKSDFLTACFEGDDTKTIYLMYQEDNLGELVDRGFCFPKEEMGMTMELWNYLYSIEERETEYTGSSREKKPDYFLDAYFMDGLFSRRFHLYYNKDKWYCFMDDEQGHPKEQSIKLPKKGQKYMNALTKQKK